MAITSALVLYAVIWFLTLFVTLPVGLRTQGDENEVTEGTHAGAPANFRIKRTMIIVSIIAAIIWAIVFSIIVSGMISVRDFDWRDVMG